MGCQPVRNEPATSPTKRLPRSLPRHFQPEYLIRFERINTRQGIIPNDGRGFYRPLESFGREGKFGKCFSFPHFTAERARLDQTQHFINYWMWASGLALCSWRKGVMPLYFSREYFVLESEYSTINRIEPFLKIFQSNRRICSIKYEIVLCS
ncbi:hypothetical protein CEXT_764551 [Caerostris extrusa]|uniref:Uncharacterized protein n=1 Tax=Caerostris extrusa TaxID=172846 RepID=A0AAV4MXM3_CAEEX|nr:hypothetical protein CEXT_764551 [Caerostris extrusa]